MGNTWNKDTDGRVTLTVYRRRHAGRRGDDHQEDAPGVETLQAAFLTAAGLAELDEAFNVFAMPFFFESGRGGSAPSRRS